MGLLAKTQVISCLLASGRLVSGDCKKNIHVWEPQEGGTWKVDQRPFSSHSKSVEDLQWSPTEATVCLSKENDYIKIFSTSGCNC